MVFTVATYSISVFSRGHRLSVFEDYAPKATARRLHFDRDIGAALGPLTF